jgi:dTDP-4-amino-4,6-dideoxygalactose transaminase
MTRIQTSVPFVDFQPMHQPIQKQIEQAVQNVLSRGDFILGQAVREFEAEFAKACGVSQGVGVACGTDAIALGLQACDIGTGDEVLVPANTFIASVIGILHAGATPVFIDCDPKTALLDLNAAEKAVTPRTKAVLAVHLYGQMVSPRQLLDFASTHNLTIFEDAAQAHLAQREGYVAGSIGKAAAFSFYPSKNLGAMGSGGMVVTSDDEVAEKVRSLRNYGAPQKYIHRDLGTNSRLDTIQAAILNVKLPHLAHWNRQRQSAAQQYDTLLAPLKSYGIEPLENQTSSGHVYHLYITRIHPNAPLDRNALSEALAEQGIQTGVHYPIPCHLQPAYTYLGYQQGDFPHSEALCEQMLSLPMYPGLTSNQVYQVVDAITSVISRQAVAA